MKNLNSLYGTHSIDFENDVRDASLFLIVGPTGAGKSTILDAICLALFGRTPRLDRATGKPERDVGHVMSLGSAECLAELEFSTISEGRRERYTAAWSMRRAHQDPDGTLQRPERALTHLRSDGTSELLVSDERAKYFDPVFDRALQGLTIEDFTRSMLLAQGDFAAFLHASDEEKASILERLTSTDQYKEIGARAAQRRRELEARQRELEKSTGQMGLSREAREELEAEIRERTTSVADTRALLETGRKTLRWLRREDEWVEELATTRESLEAQRKKIEALSDDIQRLAIDEELSPIESDLRVYRDACERHEKESSRAASLAKKLETLREKTQERREAALQLERRLERARKLRDEAAPRLRRYEKLSERKKTAENEAKRVLDALKKAREEEADRKSVV